MIRDKDIKYYDFDFARNFFQDKNIVFTGKGFLVRGELWQLIRRCGGVASNTVTNKTDILIVGSKPGSKLTKATRLGCKIISIDDFKKILLGNNVEVVNDSKSSITEKNEVVELLNIEKYLPNKKVILAITNEAMHKSISEILKEMGSIIIDKSKIRECDLLVYNPNSYNTSIVDLAKELNINVITIGKFKKLITNIKIEEII